MTQRLTIPLRGPGGEPVDLARTLASHGLASLPPMILDEAARSFEVTLPVPARAASTGRTHAKGRPRIVRVRPGPRNAVAIEIAGRAPSPATAESIRTQVRRVLGLDEDLAPFYDAVRDDPDLAWAAAGAGRMIRSPTVFEEVVKTICTTNCAWSATVRMTTALVEHLGEPAAGAPRTGWRGRAFPSPAAMAAAGEGFYRDVVRAGYRGAYLIKLAEMVAGGSLDLEALAAMPEEELPDMKLAARLQALPGVGPYAAAHIMMLMGRHSLLVLDSWTRPTYARLTGKKKVSDVTIERRFRRYGRYRGLAFWLFLTREWVTDEGAG
ncbi:MAG: Fe-S cluster assembly protein HesB [Actinomycetota bacterium]|nr:Fe-S cluster assembly protein HesB [Actinomycetota bacterium]